MYCEIESALRALTPGGNVRRHWLGNGVPGRPAVARLACFGLLLSAFCLLHSAAAWAQTADEPKPAAPPTRIEPEAQALLDQTIQALGGQAFLHAKNLAVRGRLFAIAEGVTAGFAPFESTVEYPDKRRFSYGKKQPVVLFNDGDRGWQRDRYGMIRQPTKQLRRWQVANRYTLENLLRERIHEPGVLIQDAGSDFVDNLAVRVVEIIDAQQVHVKLYVRKAKFVPVRISYRVLDPGTGDWDEYATVYGDYRDIQGIQTPRHITRYRNGRRYSEIFVNTAQYNVSYPSGYFQPGG